jgi:hypothetical protein
MRTRTQVITWQKALFLLVLVCSLVLAFVASNQQAAPATVTVNNVAAYLPPEGKEVRNTKSRGHRLNETTIEVGGPGSPYNYARFMFDLLTSSHLLRIISPILVII